MRLPLTRLENIGLTIETDRFFEDSGVQLAQPTSGLFHFRRVAFSSQLKSKVGSTLANFTG
jgi:hypothetical protein